MNKELILILVYCPDKKRKKIFLEFLQQLEKFRDIYDILVASHTPLDTMFFDYFDYFYYDKNNVILTDIEYRQNGWFSAYDNYVIWSSYLGKGNTIKAILDLLRPSLSIVKNLKYEKVHFFEYDSKITNNKELIDNSKLLDEYDYIIYNAGDTHKIAGGLMSFKINSIINEWKEYNEENFRNSYDCYPKIPENILFKQIESQTNFFQKNHKNLKLNGITINTVNENCSNWNVPFYEPNTSKLKFISRNVTNEEYEIKVIVNKTLHNVGVILPNVWIIIDLLDNFDDVEHLIVLKNNINILELDFNSIEFKNEFKTYNSAMDNSSLD